jgi:hypothetical protein
MMVDSLQPRMNAFSSAVGFLLMAFLFNCVGANAGQAWSVRSLAKGAFSGITDARQQVIKDAASWEKLWKQNAVSLEPAAKVPAVDFTKEMVIAVTMGTKRTGGYAIEIVRVEAADAALKIFVRRTSPPPGALTVQALSAPYHFVAVPKSDLKPEFAEVKPDAAK